MPVILFLALIITSPVWLLLCLIDFLCGKRWQQCKYTYETSRKEKNYNGKT